MIQIYKKYIFKCIIFLEILILFILGSLAFTQWRAFQTVELSIEDWESDYIKYDKAGGGGWYIDDRYTKEGENIIAIYSPATELERGTYSVNIEYSCDADQKCEVDSDSSDYYILRTGENVILGKRQDSISFRFEAKEDIDDIRISVIYNGVGYLQIRDISIVQTPLGFIRIVVLFSILFFVLDLCFIFRRYIGQHSSGIIAIAGIVLLSSLPLLTQGIDLGHDLRFHLLRIEGIAREIRYKNIPVRISSFFMDGYGYPASIYYGDLLLYIPAVMRLLGIPVVTAYKLYILLINTGTAIIAYYCMKSIFKDKSIAFLICMAYCTASYRLVCIYVRAAVGEYSAMMFLPVIALAIYRIYTSDAEVTGLDKRNVILLAVGMSGLIGTHVLSAEMVVFSLIMICFLLWKKTFSKYILWTFFGAALGTGMLSAYFIVPFLDYYMNVPVKINDMIQETPMIQRSGAYISEYFSFFRDIFSYHSVHGNERMLLTPGPVYMMVLCAAVVFIFNKRGNKQILFLSVNAVFFLYIASNLFPWNRVAINNRLGRLLSQVQFPWRYIGIAVVFLSLLMGSMIVLIKNKNDGMYHVVYWLTIAVCFGMSCLFVSNYNDDALLVNYYDKWEWSTCVVGNGEYERQGTDIDSITGEIYTENMQQVILNSREGCKMELYCVTSELSEGTIIVPMFYYKGYRVIDENGQEYPIVDYHNNLIEFFVPANFAGNITVDFVEPWYWRLAEIISILTLLSLCMVSASHIRFNMIQSNRYTEHKGV